MARRRATKKKKTGTRYRVKATNPRTLKTSTVATCTTKTEANRVAKELRSKAKGTAVFVVEC